MLRSGHYNFILNRQSFRFNFACVHFFFIPHFADVVDYSELVLPTESSGATMYPPVFRPKGINKVIIGLIFIIFIILLHLARHPCIVY